MSNIELPNCLDEESAAALFVIAVNSVTKDNSDTTPLDQVKALATSLTTFAEATLRQFALLELIEAGKVEPTLVDGELAFRIPK